MGGGVKNVSCRKTLDLFVCLHMSLLTTISSAGLTILTLLFLKYRNILIRPMLSCLCHKLPLNIICLVLSHVIWQSILTSTSLIIVFNIHNNRVLKLDISSASSLTL